MYTQALKSGGGVAQRLNQHFNKAIRVWDLSANAVSSIRRGCFYFENRNGPARDPPIEGEIFRVFFRNYCTNHLQSVDIYGILLV